SARGRRRGCGPGGGMGRRRRSVDDYRVWCGGAFADGRSSRRVPGERRARNVKGLSMDALELMRVGPVIPVIVIDDVAHGVPLAKALVAGGVRVLEVTLRTPVALEAVRAISREVADAIVGVGTISRADEFQQAIDAGARFGVSPGLTPELINASRATSLPLLPGVMTPSEIIAARAAGFFALKLFPAQQAGGIEMLKALNGPFPDVIFCPTG